MLRLFAVKAAEGYIQNEEKSKLPRFSLEFLSFSYIS